MKPRLMMAASVLATLAIPLAAQAQGVVRVAEEGAAVGNRAAGPVGGAIGAGVGGVVGGVKGVLGIPERHRSTLATARIALNLPQTRSPINSPRVRPASKLTCALRRSRRRIGPASRAP